MQISVRFWRLAIDYWRWGMGDWFLRPWPIAHSGFAASYCRILGVVATIYLSKHIFDSC